MKILIASDHAGFELKEKIKRHYSEKYLWEDYGTFSTESVDYPDFAHPVAAAVSENPDQLSVLICGTGNGVAMTANKHPNVRAALSWTPEIAVLAKEHNNANILVLPARFISDEMAFQIIDAFFSASFQGGRHQRRIDKINLNDHGKL